MAVRDILKMGDARLLRQAQKVLAFDTDALHLLVLDLHGLRGQVPRYARIRYTGWDAFGEPIDRTVEGFHARVVQHECDHLWGKLYPMRMRDFTQFGFTEVLFPGIAADEDD